ncbi:ArsR/SmtB family transcription factor [Haladaptatus sp. NG-SE-30]
MESSANIDSWGGSKLILDIPTQDTNLFKSQTVHEILSFLCRYHTDEFSITELADAVDYSQPTISKAVGILVANDLVVARREGNTKQIHINRGRLSRPDDPLALACGKPQDSHPAREFGCCLPIEPSFPIS